MVGLRRRSVCRAEQRKDGLEASVTASLRFVPDKPRIRFESHAKHRRRDFSIGSRRRSQPISVLNSELTQTQLISFQVVESSQMGIGF
ncbi:hypothetical protein F0562_021208 [Nyssa sinensis]|uniref:Uncharacterized protein n=1 Tax=Nyssa sinensis TaxID=561372 RepID=A0A5J5BNB8_9ASTE|nr:hypothetical protein F0562_021208 [Nyssa sinensis]